MNRLLRLLRRNRLDHRHAAISVHLHPSDDEEADTDICLDCLKHLAYAHPRYFEEMRELLDQMLDAAWRERIANL